MTKIKFTNFWHTFNPNFQKNGQWIDFLFGKFSAHDIKIGSVFGTSDQPFDLLFSGECINDLRHNGSNFTFTPIRASTTGRSRWFMGVPFIDHPRSLHLPLFYAYWSKYISEQRANLTLESSKKEFGLSVVVSNLRNGNLSKRRSQIAHQLSLHLPVHANRAFSIGAPSYSRVRYHDVDDKLEFISQYTHHLAFESNTKEGYITEKAFDALFVGSVPVYEGDPRITEWIDGVIVCTGLSARQIFSMLVSQLDLVERFSCERTNLCNVSLDVMKGRIGKFSDRIIDEICCPTTCPTAHPEGFH